MLVGHATILREVRRNAQTDANVAPIRVAGIDDWAWKKGMNDGTVIVDLERWQVVDVLSDRLAASTAEWLKRHPTIEVISRDRGGLYAEGAREGAPQARQVADRFHLLQNFREAAERQLTHPGGPAGRNNDSIPKRTDCRRVSEGAQRQLAQRAARAAELARFDEIKVLYEAGESITAIARALGLGRRAIEPKTCTPAYFERFLSRRFSEGNKSVRLLFAEVKKQGYTGSYSHLARFIAPWKDAGQLLGGIVETPLVSPLPALASLTCAVPSAATLDPTTGRRISPLTASALCVKPRGQMTSRQLSIVNTLKAGSEDFTTMRQLAMRLSGLFRERSAEKLDEWLRDAFSCGVFTMRRFAKTLRQDKCAVQNVVMRPVRG